MPIAFPLFWSITITLHNWIWCYLMNKSSRSSWIYILCYSEIVSILEWVNLITLTLTSFVKKTKQKTRFGSIWHTLNYFIIVSKFWFFWTDMCQLYYNDAWCMQLLILVSAFTWKTITQIPPLSEWLCANSNTRGIILLQILKL